MNVLVFDNYDSFTYNLVHLAEKIIGQRPDVFRNDAISLDEVDRYTHIILSPGPGIPSEAGSLLPLIKRYASSKKILGVCLGHQAIGEAFGATLTNLSRVYHGVATTMTQEEPSVLFNGLPKSFLAGRYHSWIVDRESIPAEFKITASDENGYVMGMEHRELNIHSMQFHPESVLTPDGEKMLRNWFS